MYIFEEIINFIELQPQFLKSGCHLAQLVSREWARLITNHPLCGGY